MPKAFNPKVEAKLQKMLDGMREREDAKNGPGAFDHMQRKGRLLLTKTAAELTPEEAAFLEAPLPAQMQ